jgi:hypothetical protein
MAEGAFVTSIEALEEFKAKLSRFGVEANNALAGLDLQIRRAFEWLEEQAKFWKAEVRRRQEEVVYAKGQLMHRRAMGTHGRGPGTTEQEIALEEAVRRLHEAEDKVHNCRRWAQELPQEVPECETPARQLAGMIEVELRKGVALLEQKLRSLEAYVQTNAGPVGGSEGPEKTVATDETREEHG